MFNKTLIPAKDNQIHQHLATLFNQSGASEDQKSAIERKLNKIKQTLKQKIANTLTISEYFDQLWRHPDLKDKEKEKAIRKTEAIHQGTKNKIQNGQTLVSKVHRNLDNVISSFKMSTFEEFILQDKVKVLKQNKKLDSDNILSLLIGSDLTILHSLNKPNNNSESDAATQGALHYLGNMVNDDVDEAARKAKAEEFVKRIQGDKKAFNRKLRRIERSVEDREMQDILRIKQRQQEEEDLKNQEKKKKLEVHIQELKARSEARIKESSRWEDEYKAYRVKKPLYKEIEEKYQNGFVIPELEVRKRKLQEIRDFHKPINRSELLEHEQKIMRSLEEQNFKKKDALEESKWFYKKPDYESKYHRMYAEEIMKGKKQKENEQSLLLKRKEKVIELMKEVKEKHQPKIDPHKEVEMVGLIDRLRNVGKKKNGRSRTADGEEPIEAMQSERNPRKLGDDYLKFVRHLLKKGKDVADTPREGVSRRSIEESGIMSDRPGPDKKLTATSLRSEPQKVKKRNYLAELRRENKLPIPGNQVDWIMKKKDLNNVEKNDLLQNEIEKMETKVKRKEMIRKYKRRSSNLEDVLENDEMDKIYINAIKAKLEMLGG